MGYAIIWLEPALGDLGHHVEYIAKDNPLAAERMGNRIIESVSLLANFPRMGHVFSKLQRDDVREIVVAPYRIVYHIKDSKNSIAILTVWHGAQREPIISPEFLGE